VTETTNRAPGCQIVRTEDYFQRNLTNVIITPTENCSSVDCESYDQADLLVGVVGRECDRQNGFENVQTLHSEGRQLG
jgi:hypothetical protein